MSFDTGNLLTFLLVIAGFIGVYLHSRSVKIAEKELEIKVVEINDLIQRLEEERKQREKETNERIASQAKETVERINSQAELQESQNSMNRILLDIERGSERNLTDYIVTISLTTGVLSKAIKDSLKQTEDQTVFSELLSNIQSLNADMLDLIGISQKWSKAIETENYDSRKKREEANNNAPSSNRAILLLDENRKLKNVIESLEKEFTPQVEEIRNRYNQSQSSFIQLLKKYVN